MRRLVLCMLVLGSVLSMDLGTSLLSMDLNDVALLDTTSMSCATPQNEFERVSSQMAAWADIVQHKDSLHRDIQRLEGIKELIEKRKFKTLEKQLEKLELPKTESRIGEPILAEFRQKLKGLSNPETADECEGTLLKLCIYLLKQFNSCRQQCQSNPVTVIKIKGKIKDLQVVQQSCGQPAPCEDEPGIPDEPVIPDEPTPVVPDEPTPVVPDEEQPTPPDEEAPPVVPDEETVTPPDEESPPVVPDEEQPTPPDEEAPPTPDEEQPPVVPDEEQPTPPDEEAPPVVPEEETVTPPDEEAPPVVPDEEQPTPPDEEAPPTPDEEQPPVVPEEESPTPPDEEVPPTPDDELPESPEELSEEPVDEPPVNPSHEESPEEFFEETVEEEFEEFEEPPIVPPVVPPVEVVEKTCLNSVNENVYTSSVDEATPLVTKQLEGDDLSCYGFGFYARWLQAYPTYLVHGRQDEKYFVARISESPHVTGAVTDDALSVFLTREGFEFQSYDGEGTSSTVINVGDIEGQWLYVYFSYCDGKAVAIVNENGQTSLNELNVSHNQPSELYFQLAGQSGDVKSFQGQFTLVQSNVGQNVFIETPAEATEFVFNCNQLQQQTCDRQISNLHDFEFKGHDSAFDASAAIENSEPIFAQEYSVSGWFKWYPVQDQASWHTAFRLTLNNVATNQNAKQLGDRDLALFVGNEHKDSILAFTTYTYNDLYGDGNPTYWQAVPYEKDLVHWHFIYFGFSRHISKAYGFVEFFTRKGEVHFENVKHFDAPHKYLFVGQDQFYPSYNGKIFNLHYNLCDGSYRELKYDEHWGYTPKPTDPVPPPPPEVPVEPEETAPEPEPEVPEEPVEPEPEVPEETVPEPEEPVSEEEWTPPPPLPIPEEDDEPPYEEHIVIPPPEPSIPDEPQPEEEEEVVPPPESEEESPPDTPVEPEEPAEEVPEPPVEPEEEVPEPPVEPSPEPVPEPEPPAPVPQPKCPPTIEVNKENAADILCELSHYLGEFAQGHTPATGANLKKVCFCMTYNEDYAPPTLLQLASKIPGHIQLNEPKVAVPLLKKFIKQRQ